MTTKARRILYYIFSVVFVVLTVVIILYASGYRYDLRQKDIYQSGLLVLRCNTVPNRVFIDGKERKIASNTIKVNNLKPGSHDVRLEKDGYIPWQKTVIINPGEASTHRNIDFFREGNFELLLAELQVTAVSPSGKLLAYTKSSSPNAVSVFNLENEREEYASLQASDAITAIEWSPTENDIMVSFANLAQRALINLPARNIQVLQFLPSKTEPMSFSRQNPGHLHLLREKNLIDLNTITGQQVTLLSDIVGWKEYGNRLIAVEQQGGTTNLIVYEDGTSKTLFALPALQSPSITESESDIITVHDQESRTLVLGFKQSGKYQTRTFTGTTHLAWLEEKDLLVFGNEVELFLYVPKTDETVLLTRSGVQFQEIGWLSPLPVVYVSQETGLQLLQIQDLAIQQAVTISSHPARSVLPHNKGNTVFIITPSGSLQRQIL